MAASFIFCPFCRMVDIAVEHTSSGSWMLTHHCDDGKTTIMMYADTEEELIDKWNTRFSVHDTRARLLSLREVYQSFGSPIWLATDKFPEGRYVVLGQSQFAWEIDFYFFGSDEYDTLDIDDYNKKWFPYDRKPHGGTSE